MSVGMEVYNENGAKIIGLSSNLCRFLGKFSPTEYEGHKEIPLEKGERLFAFPNHLSGGYFYVNGNSIKWKFLKPPKKIETLNDFFVDVFARESYEYVNNLSGITIYYGVF